MSRHLRESTRRAMVAVVGAMVAAKVAVVGAMVAAKVGAMVAAKVAVVGAMGARKFHHIIIRYMNIGSTTIPRITSRDSSR